MAVATEFVSDLLVGGMIGLGGAQDDAATKDERLGS
jgi:hypothetical protein